eukprot:GHUV01045277.1.p1 GENE.GHUV01045277.1~~GHUV01045277.1.p1  ORF type:complete len:126 (+),score=16.70 GHUV01045277.1:247-624(+)
MGEQGVAAVVEFGASAVLILLPSCFLLAAAGCPALNPGRGCCAGFCSCLSNTKSTSARSDIAARSSGEILLEHLESDGDMDYSRSGLMALDAALSSSVSNVLWCLLNCALVRRTRAVALRWTVRS